jgi:hypothetical protein
MGDTAGHGVLEGAVQMQVIFVMIVTASINAQGRLAQLVERLVYTEVVGGSSPSPPIGWGTITDRAFGSSKQLLKVDFVVNKRMIIGCLGL